MNIRRFLDYVLLTTMSVLILLMVWFIVRLILPYRPVADLNSPFPVDLPVVAAGEAQRYSASFCKRTDAPAITQIAFVTQERSIYIGESSFTAPSGCYSFRPTILVPEEATAGKAKIVFTSTYDYGFLKRVTVRSETEEFDIKSENKAFPIGTSPNIRPGSVQVITPAPIIRFPDINIENNQESEGKSDQDRSQPVRTIIDRTLNTATSVIKGIL